MDIFQNTYFAFFLMIAIGYMIGKIKIAGISLDISAILFVAMLFGHYGVKIDNTIQNIGLVLFIYTIGMQAGPGFFETFKKEGRAFALFGLILVGSAALITLAIKYFFDIDKAISIGLLTGALTSTPGLAVAIDSTQSPLAPIGYGIAYPFGVIGVIIFIKLLPKFSRKDLSQAEEDYKNEALTQHPLIVNKNFRIENTNIDGKTLEELRIRHMTKAVVSRIMHGSEAFVPNKNSVIRLNDIVKVVGPEDSMEKVRVLLGSETTEEIPLSKKYDVRSILVSNREVVNLTIKELNLLNIYNATITRIRRSGIDITPSPGTRIQLGDKLMIACDTGNMGQVSKLLGNDDSKLSDSDLLPMTLGIVMGVILGNLSLSFSDAFKFNLGLTGGVLATGLILSKIGKTGKIVWSMSGAANQLLRQIGLLFFLTSVGTKAGAQLVPTFNEYGLNLFILGAVITILPMIFASVFGKYVLKLNILKMLGALTGGMTSTPGLAATTSMTESDAPQIAYATIYPLAIVLLIIFVQALSLF